jgi:hypothetical protein
MRDINAVAFTSAHLRLPLPDRTPSTIIFRSFEFTDDRVEQNGARLPIGGIASQRPDDCKLLIARVDRAGHLELDAAEAICAAEEHDE